MTDTVDFSSFEPYTPPPPTLTIEVYGQFNADGGIEVTSVTRAIKSAMLRTATDGAFVLLDANDNELVRAGYERHLTHSINLPSPSIGGFQPLECTYFLSGHFSAEIPSLPGGATLAFVRDDKEWWRFTLPGPPPAITAFTCAMDGEVVRLAWADSVRSDAPAGAGRQVQLGRRAWLSLTADATHSSDRSVAAPLADESFRTYALEHPLVQLPPGDVSVAVMVSNGFDTVCSEPIVITVAERPIEIDIEAPTICVAPIPEGCGKLVLNGTAFTHRAGGHFNNGGISTDANYRWLIDGHLVGRGTRAYVTTPAPGTHELTLALSWKGQALAKSITFEVTNDMISAVVAALEMMPAIREAWAHLDWTEARFQSPPMPKRP